MTHEELREQLSDAVSLATVKGDTDVASAISLKHDAATTGLNISITGQEIATTDKVVATAAAGCMLVIRLERDYDYDANSQEDMKVYGILAEFGVNATAPTAW